MVNLLLLLPENEIGVLIACEFLIAIILLKLEKGMIMFCTLRMQHLGHYNVNLTLTETESRGDGTTID